ncbi:MAG TPA: type IX secretion system sortase PorU [Candidatus Latescibacteria bacterium]|jgi:hypothetical protein|nr:type IX secretion system sortase PorU [Candidatus Latescibacterota bacterium]
MFHRYCLLVGFLISTSLSAQLPAPSAKTFPVPATKVEVLATGKGFVRLQFRANLGILGDETTDRTGEFTQPVVTLARQWMHTSLVGLPRGAQPRLHVLEAKVATDWQVEFDSSHQVEEPGEGPARLGQPVTLRDQYAVPVTFMPQRDAHGQLNVYERVVIDVVFDDPGATMGWPAKDDRFEPVYRSLLINERQARAWRTRHTRPVRKTAQRGISPTDGMIRVTVRSEGMYRVTADDLVEAGADLAGVDPNHIRVLYGGGSSLGLASRASNGVLLREQAAVISGGDDGSFNGEDAVIFHGVGTERWDFDRNQRVHFWRRNVYTHDNAYWIDLHATNEATRPTPRDGSIAQTPSAVVDSYRHRLHEEDERTILRQLFGMNSGYDWYWEPFSGNARNYPIAMSQVVPNEPVLIRAGFWGWTNATHIFEVMWNESSLGIRSFSGSNYAQISASAYEGPIEGLNQFGLIHRTTNLTRLDWFQIQYQRYLDGSEGVLAFDWPIATDGGAFIDTTVGAVIQYELRGFAPDEGTPRIFIVSAGLQEVVDFEYDDTTGDLRFQDWFSGKGRPPRYVAVQTPFLRRPSAVTVDTQRPLRESAAGADDIIVTHSDFSEAAQRLADWRAQDRRFGDPMTTMVVDVQDIYDEFSGGLVDPMAIRAFVNHTFDNWSPRPTYITLMGDGTYDYKNNSGTSHTNWIPPYQDGESTYDEWYVRVEGEDRAPEMAIGRLPVSSLNEAQDLVDKIIAYDRGDTPGPWQGRVLLVADDLVNPQESLAFESYFLIDAERLARNLLPDGLDLTKLYIASYPLEGRIKPRARDEFIKRFNEGALLLTYLGHGNPETLAHEQMFLLSRDLSAIDNGGRLPFMYTAASQVGVFDDPQRQSMPEVLLNLPAGGVIGFISATRVGFHDSNVSLARHFHGQMFRSQREHVPVGLALLEAKILTHPLVDLRDDVANISRYSLMGDPALRLARPRLKAVLNVPDTLEALQEALLSGRIESDGGQLQADYSGEALVRVFDSSASTDLEGLFYTQLGAPIFRGVADVVDGLFSVRFRVPKDITYRAVLGRASAYVLPEDDLTGDVRVSPAFGSQDSIVLQGTASGVEVDEIGPRIEIGFQGQTGFRDGDFVSSQPVLAAVLADDSGINIAGETGHEIVLEVDDVASIVTDNYTSQDGDYRQGLLEVPLPALEPGDHTIRLKAWDSFNNSTRVEAAVRVAEAADAALTDLLFHPNPSPDGSGHFTYILSAPAESARLRVYALSGRLVEDVDAGAGFGYNQVPFEPQSLAGGTYLYRLEVNLTDGPRIEADGRLQVVPQ